MIERAIKLFLFVFICAVLIVFLRFGCEDSNAIDVMPKVVGSASTDSVRINFGTIDTTYYPAVLDADSLIILIYPPDNAAPESTADGGTGVFNLTTGFYQYHRRGSNATPDLGVYTVCVKAWRGSAVRGIGVCSYLVTPAGTYHYGVQDSTRDLAKDSLANAIHADNKVNFHSSGDTIGREASTFDPASDSTFPDKSHLWNLGVDIVGADAESLLSIRNYAYATQESINAHAPHGNNWASVGAGGADLSDEVDSLLAVLYDRTNDSNFVRLIAHLLLHDSVTIDNSNAWDLSGGTDLSNEVDSLLAVLYDRTNDSNFVRLIAHLILHDSVTIDKSNAWGLRSGLSTFDHTSDKVTLVDTSAEDISYTKNHPDDFKATNVDSVRKVYYLDSLDQEVSASVSQSDKEDIAKIVKDTAEAHPEIWTDQASGTGADTFDIYVFDADTTAVEGVSITIYNKGHTAVVAPSLITDVNGLATTFQDADTFHLYLQRLGVIYAEWDTIVVSNLGIDTIWVVAYDPGASPSAHLTRVKGFARDLGYGADERIRITFALHNKNILDTTQTPAVFVDRKPIVISFADSFNVDLIPSGSMISKELGIVKDSIKYDVKIEVGGRAILEYFNVFIPGPDTTVWLEDLLE